MIDASRVGEINTSDDYSDSRVDRTKRGALVSLFFGTLGIAVGYAAAFSRSGTPVWAPWLLALGIPISIGGIMVLGAARGRKGVGSLKLPFLFVVAILAIGFCAALALPANETGASRLWLGLPARAAVIIYGVGLLPIVVLPVAYALTFETLTLTAEDVERVRELGRQNRADAEHLANSNYLANPEHLAKSDDLLNLPPNKPR